MTQTFLRKETLHNCSTFCSSFCPLLLADNLLVFDVNLFDLLQLLLILKFFCLFTLAEHNIIHLHQQQPIYWTFSTACLVLYVPHYPYIYLFPSCRHFPAFLSLWLILSLHSTHSSQLSNALV